MAGGHRETVELAPPRPLAAGGRNGLKALLGNAEGAGGGSQPAGRAFLAEREGSGQVLGAPMKTFVYR